MENKMLYEIGGENGFKVGEVIEIPNGHFLLIVQGENIFAPIRRNFVKLCDEDVNGLEEDLFSEKLDIRLFIGKDYDRFTFDITDAPIELSDGTQLTYSATIKANVDFLQPEQTLAMFLENEDPSDSDIFIDTYTNECGIRALIEEELTATLFEQPFYNPDTGEIIHGSLDQNHLEFMDYVAIIESNIEIFFCELGMNIQIEIESLTSKLSEE